MKLYDMLKNTRYYGKVRIYEGNAYDQNIRKFAGSVSEARTDEEDVFDLLMCDVDMYYCTHDWIIIIVKSKEYEIPCEKLFQEKYVQMWDRNNPNTRPWVYMCEIDEECKSDDFNDKCKEV